MSKPLKPLNLKAAEKICEALKAESFSDLRELNKILTKWERTYNQVECIDQIQQILNSWPEIAKMVNEYVEQQGRFVVHKTFAAKAEELFAFLKVKNPGAMEHVLRLLHASKAEAESNGSEFDTDQKITNLLLDYFKHDQETYPRVKMILDEGTVKAKVAPQKDNPAKKSVRPAQEVQEQEKKVSLKQRDKRKEISIKAVPASVVAEPPAVVKPKTVVSFSAPGPQDQMQLLFSLEKKLPQISKIISLYELCILNREDVFAMVSESMFDSEEEYEMFKDTIETRELSRRRGLNLFKPLIDIDFTGAVRATFSYVKMPWSYAVYCSSKTSELYSILNDKWVSVPHGSQHTNFSIRHKNQFQQNLLKSQDERYQFDLYTYRLRKASDLLGKIVREALTLSEEESQSLLNTVIGMGVLQLLYRNCQKEQKEEIEQNLKLNKVHACNIIKARVNEQLTAMTNIRQFYGLKNWHEAAEKNFYKSLDRKNFILKKTEREYTKNAYYEAELQQRAKIVTNKEPQRVSLFEEKQPIFSLLNTFEVFSKHEKCLSHQTTSQYFQQFETDCEDPGKRKRLPLLFMEMGNIRAQELTYTLLLYYINVVLTNESEKVKLRKYLTKVLESILGWNGLHMALREEVTEEMLAHWFAENTSRDSLHWIFEAKIDSTMENNEIQENNLGEGKQLQTYDEDKNREGFLPGSGAESSVMFASTNFYCLVRLLYTIYERLLKAMEYIYDYAKTRNFQSLQGITKLYILKVLFMVYIKSKDNSKFEDFLHSLFGESAYLFATLFKLFESLTKMFQVAMNCPYTSKLLDLYEGNPHYPLFKQNEELYLHAINKTLVSGNYQNTDKLVRLVIGKNGLISVNYLTNYAKPEAPKEYTELISQEAFQTHQLGSYLTSRVTSKIPITSKRVPARVYFNNMDYIYLEQPKKLVGLASEEDFLTQRGQPKSKQMLKDLKRRAKLEELMQLSG